MDSIKKIKKSTDQLKKTVIDHAIIDAKLKQEQKREQDIELRKLAKERDAKIELER